MFKCNVLAVSLSLVALCTAQAATADINGGGSTLPQPLYQTAGVLTAGFAPYIGVGSGKGKLAFLNNDYSQFVPGSINKNVHWAASDAKLTAAELSTYRANHGEAWGPLIQVPSAATSIAIPFNKAGAAALDLSVNTLCGVFSGRLTQWEQIPSSGRTGSLTVVYPAQSSGTTELFTRFLNAKCNETGRFSVTTNFAASYSGGLPVGAVGAVTSQGVMDAMNAADGRITFMSPAYAASTLAGLDDATQVARVEGVSPTPANIATAIAMVPVPAVANRPNPNSWVPVFSTVYDPNDPSVVASPTSGYPILGFTNLIFSQCYADANQTAQVRAFFARHYGVLANNNLATSNNRLLPLPTHWKNAVRETFLTAANGLSIGNPNVCTGLGRPL